MVNRQTFDKAVGTINSIANKHANSSFMASAERITQMRDGFDIKALVVGHFSSGKSALLNTFLGRPGFLKEAQLPQTAVATELLYGKEEKYYSYSNNAVKTEISSPDAYDAKTCEHLELRLPCERLLQVDDFTVVDTPGFDSGIEKHSKALSAYIGYGSAFILVLSAEKGDIDQDALLFLEEISKYSRYLAVIISKCDKKTAEILDDVKAQIEGTLQVAGLDCPVFVTGKFDPEAPKKLLKVFEQFDAQAIFDKKLKYIIHSEAVIMHRNLEIADKLSFSDTFAIEKEIQRYKKLKSKLKQTFAAQKEGIENNKKILTDNILDSVRCTLIGNSDRIADAILSGGATGLDAIIVGIIRPVLFESLKDVSNHQIQEVIKSVSLDFGKVFSGSDDSEPIGDIINRTISDFKKILDDGLFEKAMEGFTTSQEDKDKDKKKKDLYHIATTIASLLTDIVAPWVEIIIILLPDIIAILSRIFGESQHDKIKKVFINNLVPQIVERMYPPIEGLVEKTQCALLDALETEVNERIDGINETLAALQKKKEATDSEYDNHKALIKTSLAQLKEIIHETEEN